jgi:hypothetical protein
MGAIKVNNVALENVKKIAKKQQISNGEFVELAADFFIKTGIDLKEGYSIKTEIKENNKRLNQVIAFIREQEKSHLMPIVKDLRISNELTIEYLKRLKPEKVENAFSEVAKVFSELKKEVLLNNESTINLEKRLDSANKKNNILIELLAIKGGVFGGDKERKEELQQQLQNL